MGPIEITSDVAFNEIGREILYFKGEGHLKIPGNGELNDLQIATVSDDGVRVSMDTGEGFERIINNWTDHGSTEDFSDSLTVTGGDIYPFEIEYYQKYGDLVLKLYWKAPSAGIEDWELIPADYLLGKVRRWVLTETVDIDRENGLVITSLDPSEPVRLRAPNGEAMFQIDDTNLEGDLVVSDLVFENVREGIVIESEGDNENYVVLSGLVFDGIYNSSSGSSDNFEYAILGENGRANVIAVNNTIKAPSTFGGQFNHKTAGIYLYGSCSFVGFNHLVGNFGPAILLNVDQTETPCDFDPAADNNSISLEAISLPRRILAVGGQCSCSEQPNLSRRLRLRVLPAPNDKQPVRQPVGEQLPWLQQQLLHRFWL